MPPKIVRILAGAGFGCQFLAAAFVALFAPIVAAVTLSAAPTPAAAQSMTGDCWSTIVGAGTTQCYSTAYQACYKQFQVYAFTGIGPYEGTTPTSSPLVYGCNWEWHIGDSRPSIVQWVCKDGSLPVSGKCAGEDVPGPTGGTCSNIPCGGTQAPTTPKPIDILSGDKEFTAQDFATANGSLTLRRVYSSMPDNGAASPIASTPIGMANWKYDFQYELQIGAGWASSSILTVVTPQGGVVAFQRQSDGSLTPYANPSYIRPQAEYTLAIVGSWPSDLSTLQNASTQWTLTGPDDSTWTLQTFPDPTTGLYTVARPVTMVRRDGMQWTFTYTAPYQLASITDSYSNQITFDWLVDDFTYASGPITVRAISKAHLPGGYAVAYNYSTIGSFTPVGPQPDILTSVQYLDASGTSQDQTTYQYSNANFPYAITGILDKDGVTRWSVTYDSQGRATSSSGPSGADNFSVAYGTIGGLSTTFTRTVTNPLGKQIVYTYTRGGSGSLALTSVDTDSTTNTPATTTAYTYDTNGFIASRTDENSVEQTYTRNARGLPTEAVEASGTSSARTTDVTWDSTRRLPTEVVQPGLTTTVTYDTTTGGGTGGGGAGTNKRYWRILISDNTGGDAWVNLAEVQMFETPGSADLARSATVTSSTTASGWPASQSIDGNIFTTASLSPGTSPPWTNVWWQADFGAGANKSIEAVTITAYPPGATTSTDEPPKDFAIQSSPDGFTWTTAWSVTGQTGWGGGETRTFVNPSYTYTGSWFGSHTYWRLAIGETDHSAGAFSMQEMTIASTPGGTDVAGSATMTATQSYPGGYGPDKAVDGNSSTLWSSINNSLPQYVQFHFSSAVAVVQSEISARSDCCSTQTPTSGTLQYSDDGTTWHEGMGIRNTANTWTSGQNITFTDPTYVAP